MTGGQASHGDKGEPSLVQVIPTDVQEIVSQHSAGHLLLLLLLLLCSMMAVCLQTAGIHAGKHTSCHWWSYAGMHSSSAWPVVATLAAWQHGAWHSPDWPNSGITHGSC
jgi:hypothetical protein